MVKWSQSESLLFSNFQQDSQYKDKFYPNGAKYIKHWLENESQPIKKFCFLKISSLILKDQRESIICTMVEVRGDIFRPPHGTTPAAIIANKK